LKAGTCVSTERSFARQVLMVTKYTVTMDFDGGFGDISTVTTWI
jgi:2-methylisocitrate lyase-like PEP mutase family enzyme